jgi:hypothetical protein
MPNTVPKISHPLWGRNKAFLAVAHLIMEIIWLALNRHTYFVNIGGNYFDKLDDESVRHRVVNHLKVRNYRCRRWLNGQKKAAVLRLEDAVFRRPRLSASTETHRHPGAAPEWYPWAAKRGWLPPALGAGGRKDQAFFTDPSLVTGVVISA